ncbi:MAG: Ig-like domain-containing protein [Burkholderiales bacterium]
MTEDMSRSFVAAADWLYRTPTATRSLRAHRRDRAPARRHAPARWGRRGRHDLAEHALLLTRCSPWPRTCERPRLRRIRLQRPGLHRGVRRGAEHAATLDVAPANDTPLAAADAAATNENTAVVTGDVLANDALGDQPTTIVGFDAAQQRQGGTVAPGPGNASTYTSAAAFSGTDTFTYIDPGPSTARPTGHGHRHGGERRQRPAGEHRALAAW